MRQKGETLHSDWWMPGAGALTLPALRVRMGDFIAEIALQAGADPRLVDYAPDTALQSAFGAQPSLSTAYADSLGFLHDQSLLRLVASALGTISTNERPPS